MPALRPGHAALSSTSDSPGERALESPVTGPAPGLASDPTGGSERWLPLSERRTRHPWVPRLASLLVAFVGLVDLASALTRPLHDRIVSLTAEVPLPLTRSAAAATVVTGLLLLMLAKGLRHRKRRAWQAASLLLVASVLFHLV
ncbi:MAG: lysyl-tRNA synthetase, class, partial [Frankiales bacterium]|nr:lysyl-tRNA synthetase, class [Frankiales bacterium]